MKNKGLIKKIIVYGLIALVLIAAGLFAYSGKIADKYPDYTSFSVQPNGVKALYLLTGQMGYDVDRFMRPSKSLPDKAVLVAVKPDTTILNDSDELKYLKKWIENGNILILIDDISNMDNYKLPELVGENFHVPDAANEKGFYYNMGKGKMVFLDEYDIYTNSGIGDGVGAVNLITILDDAGKKKVLFDEYYHGMQEDAITLWNLLGQGGELVVIQIFLSLLIFMLIKARRFGKPITVFEIIKRKENENLFALSNIYLKARSNSLVLETYLTDFKKQLSKYLGFGTIPDDQELLTAASYSKFLCSKNFKALFYEYSNYLNEKSHDTKKLIRIVDKLEEIRKGIK